MINRQYNIGLVALVVIAICILALIFGAAVIALRGRNQALNLIIVPDDYATIQAAIDAAQQGDIIQVRSGTYNENITLNKGVVLTAESFDQINPVNNAAIIDGMGGGATIAIPAGLTQLPTIRGFVIRNGVNGIQASSEFIAEFNYFHSSAVHVNYQLGGGGTNHNNLYFNSLEEAIHMDNTDRPLLIENNRIMYAGEDGIEVNLQNNPVPPALIEVHIWNNMIIGSDQDAIQFVDYGEAPQDTNRRFLIVGNLLAASKKAGIGLMPNGDIESYSGADTAEAIRAFNNTYYGNDHGISGGDNFIIFNSIIVNSATRGAWRVQGLPGSNSVIAYTLFHGNLLDTEETVVGAGVITGLDPLFVAAPNPGPDGTWETVDDDFSGLVLRSGSPAIDRGVTQYIAANGEAVPAFPLTGFAGAAPDLGWREFGSPAFITATPSPVPSDTPRVVLTLPTPTPVVITATPGPATATPPPTATVPSPTLQPSVTNPAASITPSLTPTPTSTATPAPLGITSINPIAAQANTTINMTITGTDFAPGILVTFEGGTGAAPEAIAVQVVNATTIVATVNTKANASTQVWDVRVTKLDASSAVLLDAFTVTP